MSWTILPWMDLFILWRHYNKVDIVVYCIQQCNSLVCRWVLWIWSAGWWQGDAELIPMIMALSCHYVLQICPWPWLPSLLSYVTHIYLFFQDRPKPRERLAFLFKMSWSLGENARGVLHFALLTLQENGKESCCILSVFTYGLNQGIWIFLVNLMQGFFVVNLDSGLSIQIQDSVEIKIRLLAVQVSTCLVSTSTRTTSTESRPINLTTTW